jgi:hypothetical protein
MLLTGTNLSLPRPLSANLLQKVNEKREISPESKKLIEELSHSPIHWKKIGKGLEFTQLDIHRNAVLEETIAAIRLDPEQNKIRVFNSYDGDKTVVYDTPEWQRSTSATAVINSAQYMANPYFMPCALVLCDGVQKGPKSNKQVRGMLVAEPADSKSPKADLLDFDYDQFDIKTNVYAQGVQHWPILLDRNGNVKVIPSQLQSSRSVVAKDFRGNILFLTTERRFFTLHHLGLFLKKLNQSADRGFHIHTAMNLDGGNEANLLVKTPDFSYFTCDNATNSNPQKNLRVKVKLPGVIGVFPR